MALIGSYGGISGGGGGGGGVGDATAADIPFTPAGTIEADNVQDAIEEAASEAGGAVTGSMVIAVSAKAALDPATIGGIDWLHSPGASSSGVADFETASTRHNRKMTGGMQIKQRYYNQQAATAGTASGDDAWTWTDGLVSLSSNDSQRITLVSNTLNNFGFCYVFPASR